MASDDTANNTFIPSPKGYWPSPEQEQVYRAFQRHDPDAIREICAKHPHVVTPFLPGNPGQSWVALAVSHEHPFEVIQALLDVGFDPNAQNLPTYVAAIGSASRHPDALRVLSLLLDRGADINLGRPAIDAILNDDQSLRPKLLQLLLDHGLDINKLYDTFGDPDQLFTVLDSASDPDSIQLIQAVGGRHAVELVGLRAASPAHGSTAFMSEVFLHFRQNFGALPSHHRVLTLPSPHPVFISTIKPGLLLRRHHTLFTVGLSGRKMNVPPGQEAYQHAEIYLQLPKSWKPDLLDDPASAWPMRCLEKLARYPHEQNTWLTSQTTVISLGKEPLGPNTACTAFLLSPNSSTQTTDGAPIHFYQALPIHPSEYDYALKEGPLALLTALDKKKVSRIIDIRRPSAI